MQLFCGEKIILRIFNNILVLTLSYCNSELPNIPSMQNWVLLVLILNTQIVRFLIFTTKQLHFLILCTFPGFCEMGFGKTGFSEMGLNLHGFSSVQVNLFKSSQTAKVSERPTWKDESWALLETDCDWWTGSKGEAAAVSFSKLDLR